MLVDLKERLIFNDQDIELFLILSGPIFRSEGRLVLTSFS